MELMLQEIERALQGRLYYLAVLSALTVPDVCAALESADGQTTAARYMDWYNEHLSATYPQLTAQDCWTLRCGVAHQGRMGHPDMQYGRVLFTLPVPQRIIVHRNVLNDAPT